MTTIASPHHVPEQTNFAIIPAAFASWLSGFALAPSFLKIIRASVLVLNLLLPFTLSAKDTPRAILSGLPDTIADCKHGEIEDYGDPRLGCSVDYAMPGLLITIYVYDQGRRRIADGITDSLVTQSFAMAKADIQTAVTRGMYSGAKLESDGKVSHDGGFETLSARYYLTREQEPDTGLKMFSEIHIFGARDHIIKIRVSGEKSREAELGKIVDQFIPAFVSALGVPKR